RRHHYDRFLTALAPPAHNLRRAQDCLRVLHRRPAKLHHYQVGASLARTRLTLVQLAHTSTASRATATFLKSSLPSRASTSAFNTAAPAAPRIVLWLRTTNFQSSRLHSRSRPTVDAIPCPRMRSSRGCGRSTLASNSTGCSGAV